MYKHIIHFIHLKTNYVMWTCGLMENYTFYYNIVIVGCCVLCCMVIMV